MAEDTWDQRLAEAFHKYRLREKGAKYARFQLARVLDEAWDGIRQGEKMTVVKRITGFSYWKARRIRDVHRLTAMNVDLADLPNSHDAELALVQFYKAEPDLAVELVKNGTIHEHTTAAQIRHLLTESGKAALDEVAEEDRLAKPQGNEEPQPPSDPGKGKSTSGKEGEYDQRQVRSLKIEFRGEGADQEKKSWEKWLETVANDLGVSSKGEAFQRICKFYHDHAYKLEHAA